MSSQTPVGAQRLGDDERRETLHDGVSGVRTHDDRTHDERHERVGRTGVAAAPRTQTSDPVQVTMPPQRDDEVRWGPIWAGLVVALGIFLLLELVAFAVGLIELGQGASDGTTSGIVSGVIGLIAFFMGGLTAAASGMWRSVSSGLLQGIMVWATGIIAILALSVIGGGALLGSLGSIASQLVSPDQVAAAASGASANAPAVDPAQALATARSAASYAVLGLGVTFAASALGGLLGSKVWPRKKDVQPTTARHG